MANRVFRPGGGASGAYQLLSGKNQPNGYAGLDSNGDIVGTILVRRLTNAALAVTVLAQGEICITTDAPFNIVVGDGVTVGSALFLPFDSGNLYTNQFADPTIDSYTIMQFGAANDITDGTPFGLVYTPDPSGLVPGVVTIGAISGDALGFAMTGGLFIGNSLGGQLTAVPLRSTPTTGQTVVISAFNNIIDPAGTLANLTVQFPASPADGRTVRYVSTQTVTTLTTDGNGKTVVGSPASLVANVGIEYVYNAGGNKWYRFK